MTRRSFLAATLAAISVSGCGAGRGSLSGTVSFRKARLTHGRVSAIGSDAVVYFCEITGEGTYTLPDLPGGTVRLAVESTTPDTPAEIAAAASAPRDPYEANLPIPQRGPQPAAKKAASVPLPANYANFDESGLSATVSGATQFDIEIA
jgi:hypothetical protein